MIGETIGDESPRSRAIAEYEAYGRAHLPRLVEEALEIRIAEQTQPIEAGLRRMIADIVRECQAQMARNFLHQRPPSSMNTRVRVDDIPFLNITPLDSTDGDSFNTSKGLLTGEAHTQRLQVDTAFSSVERSLDQAGVGTFESDNQLRASSFNIDFSINSGNEYSFDSHDFRALFENYDDTNFTLINDNASENDLGLS